ncbi:MAG: hypothetical protein RMM98_17910 [Acidobacteriota bacterium]|nr:hypothetical protein [Acidobacteriota bacterium]
MPREDRVFPFIHYMDVGSMVGLYGRLAVAARVVGYTKWRVKIAYSRSFIIWMSVRWWGCTGGSLWPPA